TCNDYVKGHIQVLKDYGIENVTSNNNTWVENPNMYCFVATDNDDEMVGGIRIQVADGVTPLPVEHAIGKMDAEIYNLVKEYANKGGVGELCGLWNSKKVKGVGVSIILIRAAISAINQLKFHTITGICAEYSLDMFQQVGFVINPNLGDGGKFVYPNENYIARVVGILNGATLDTAYPYDRERMLLLRENPAQKRTEKGPKGPFTVDYNLLIENITPVILPELYLIHTN
ncbi:MAG TPA: hypothetical protein VKG26_02800, partial [Bacteroidia bacterium]|nr:hypothetical protein [Bacteroidia bacterium]